MSVAVTSKALLGLVLLAAAMALCLFVPAGTVRWPGGWIFLALFVGCSLAITVDLARRDPALLRRRVAFGLAAEPRPLQRVVQGLARLAFVATLIVPALDHRWSGSRVPRAAVVAGDVLVALGFWMVFRVFRANTFAAATVAVEGAQTVIDRGPYAVVRHPMYAGAMVMLAGIPPALGSWWGLVTIAPMAAAIVARLRDEERALSRQLAGYDDYLRRVRWRLIPGVW